MLNNTQTWISEALQGGYLRAAFIDCQIREYERLGDDIAFEGAKTLLNMTRKYDVEASHFMHDAFQEGSLTPFKNTSQFQNRFPDAKSKFHLAIPQDNEWIYPKHRPNGFSSPHSQSILSTGDICGRSTLICAGFTARMCLLETALGSFEMATNPDKHRVVIALNTTNLHPAYYQQYKTDVLMEADVSIRDQISFATNDEIRAALNSVPTPI